MEKVFESKEGSYCFFFSKSFTVCVLMFYFVLFTAAAAVDMNEIKSLTVYKDLYSFFFVLNICMYRYTYTNI